MQNGIVHRDGSNVIRLSLSKQLKEFMHQNYDIDDDYLYLKNSLFESINTIKQIRIYPPENGRCEMIVIYEAADAEELYDNGRYLSIDLGLHNLMTCCSSEKGESFIVGRRYLSICHFYNKEISRVQSQWSMTQSRKGIKYPKTSKHIRKLYRNRTDAVNDYLHKVTRAVVNYCIRNQIHTVIIGDITGIRKDNDLGAVTNQKLHALPYRKIYTMLKYKLELAGITIIIQKEAYTSQTSPLRERVSKENAVKSNRVQRGLYVDGSLIWNADSVGAYNIMRLYLTSRNIPVPNTAIKTPYILKVAA
jgi:transposase, IS605 OrfB family, central region